MDFHQTGGGGGGGGGKMGIMLAILLFDRVICPPHVRFY